MNKMLHWLPRVICILAILFVSMFALDAFGPGMTLSQQIGGFLIHLIPSFILALFLAVAWKWELIGGAILVLTGLGLTPFIYSHNYQMNHSIGMTLGIVLMLNAPFVLVGCLFILNHVLKKKKAGLMHIKSYRCKSERQRKKNEETRYSQSEKMFAIGGRKRQRKDTQKRGPERAAKWPNASGSFWSPKFFLRTQYLR